MRACLKVLGKLQFVVCCEGVTWGGGVEGIEKDFLFGKANGAKSMSILRANVSVVHR